MNIGAELRKEYDELHDMMKTVELAATGAERDAMAQHRIRLEKWHASVAVIGQIKAGKSTFLNSFIGWPGLLPSDVNPWTSVVTNLRINLRGDPAQGAAFEFYSERDWNAIIQGNSHARKLAEELLPGFDGALLRSQAETLREQTRARLGQHYDKLLGTRHTYDFLTSGLLARYVCAGSDTDESDSPEVVGRYSAMTKTADAYLRRSEFLVPTIVSDTPGVNDPFLVRDEITCQSLDKSDIFIVVLSAHQSLADADIALMRMLAREKAHAVLIYVNRIDELDDLDLSYERVRAQVKARLAEELPETEVTLHFGSAYWAEIATREDEAAALECERQDTPELAAFLRRVYGTVPDTSRERLLMASGLNAVKHSLSDVINYRIGPAQFSVIRSGAVNEMRAQIAAAKREKELLQSQIETFQDVEAERNFVESLKEEHDKLSAALERLKELEETLQTQLDELIDKSASSLRKSLEGAIEEFIENSRERIVSAAMRSDISGQSRNTLDISLLPLQEKFEVESHRQFTRFRKAGDVVLSNFLVPASQTASEFFDGIDSAIQLGNLPHSEFVSAQVTGRKTLTANVIKTASWAFWKPKQIDVEKTYAALRAITQAELSEISDKVVAAFVEALSARFTEGRERVQIMPEILRRAVSDRAARMTSSKARAGDLVRNGESHRDFQAKLLGRIEILENRLRLLGIGQRRLNAGTNSLAA